MPFQCYNRIQAVPRCGVLIVTTLGFQLPEMSLHLKVGSVGGNERVWVVIRLPSSSLCASSVKRDEDR